MSTQDRPIVQIAPGREGVSIWSEELLGGGADLPVRDFLARSFSVGEVERVELRADRSFGRISYARSGRAAEIWRQLARAFRRAAGAPALDLSDDALTLHLDWPDLDQIVVHRVGGALSTWQARRVGPGRVRLFHRALVRRRDVAFRLEEHLAVVVGCTRVRANPLFGELTLRFDPQVLSLELLVRELERCWPVVLAGDAPPTRKRLAVAAGLVGVAYAGQFLVPALRPVALLGVALYGLPNVIAALREMRDLKAGLPALYATGLIFALVRALPFHNSVMALLMQAWPQLGFHLFVDNRRRLLDAVRRRAVSARLIGGDGVAVAFDIAALERGDEILIRAGDVVPVDGVVTVGAGAVDEAALGGRAQPVEKTAGSWVYAATVLAAGELRVRVERTGAQTAAGVIAASVPLARFAQLPSAAAVERNGDRNARPALAAALGNLVLTRNLRSSQVLLRPDYVTGPRLAVQLSALYGFADGLRHGIFFRNPAALDLLSSVDAYVFDDGVGLDRRRLDVGAAITAGAATADELLELAAGAHAGAARVGEEVADALAAACAERGLAPAAAVERNEAPGVVSYRDHAGAHVEIGSDAHAAAAGWAVPAGDAGGRRRGARAPLERGAEAARLWVRRDGVVLGAVELRRGGDLEATAVISGLRSRAPQAPIAHVSSRSQDQAEALAHRVGIALVRGGLRAAQKAEAIAGHGARTLWIGDGTRPGAASAVKAALVSVSVAGASGLASDHADVVLLRGGLRQLETLRRLVVAHRERLAADYRAVYGVNLSAMVTGLAAGLGSFEVGLASNAATGLLVARHWARLAGFARAPALGPGDPVEVGGLDLTGVEAGDPGAAEDAPAGDDGAPADAG
ncbi:ATPase [Xanthobacter sp. V4C-4]|uniref:P-type ATPase n=1 Tax=Xanthobacter cornucopiae TaxID=3119924 RepID=UPI00372927A8